MKKLGCAKCGGTKKMKTGGMATKAMGPAKQPFAAGIPYYTGAGQTGPESMKNGGKVKKPLVKAQLGTIVKAFTKFAKPVAKNIIKDTKVVVRPVNRSVKPVAKKLDRNVADKFIVNKSHAKVSKNDDKFARTAAKIGLGIGATGGVGTTGLIIDTMNDKKANTKVKVKPKKK